MHETANATNSIKKEKKKKKEEETNATNSRGSFTKRDFDEFINKKIKDEPEQQKGNLGQTGKHLKEEQNQLWNEMKSEGYIKGAGNKFTFLIGEYQKCDELATELEISERARGWFNAFISTQVMRNTNVRDIFLSTSQSQQMEAFKRWFHYFSGTLNLLASRSQDANRIPLEQQQKLLKSELMRGQLQATYSPENACKLGRSLSPIVLEGYGRGVRTGLWMAAKAVRTEQIRALSQNKFSKYSVYPVNRAFTYQGLEPASIDSSELKSLKDIGSASYYIKDLGVQLILKNAVEQQGIHAYLGGRGLRASPSECADICAEYMVGKADQNDASGALKALSEAFGNKGDVSKIHQGIKKVELAPNTMMAVRGIDPLVQSSEAQMEELRQAYATFLVAANDQELPFYLHQNVQVIKNLVGEDLDAFVDNGMPSLVCGTMIEALQRANELLDQRQCQLIEPDYANKPSVLSQHMEHFYQAMQDIHHVVRFQNDWTGRAPKLEDAIAKLLPENMHNNLRVRYAPHALALLDQIRTSLSEEERASVAYLKGAYYETPELFKEERPSAQAQQISDALEIDDVNDSQLRERRVIVMEPHPNNAALDSVQPHDPVALIKNIMKDRESNKPCTLVMDVTLNHLGDKQIETTLETAKPHIESGNFNLVLLQSGTKFFQNGMDLVSIGTAAIFNRGDKWDAFNTTMDETSMPVPEDDKGYIAALLSENNVDESKAYLARVRENTATLRETLNKSIAPGHTEDNAFELCENTDKETVYIAFKPTDAYLRKVSKGNGLTSEERAKLNQELYQDKFLPAFGNLATVDRSSFGFNITNFGECYITVRITLGIEEPALLEAYAQQIIKLGAELYKNPYVVPVPAHVPASA